MSRIFYIAFACFLFVVISADTVLAQQRTIKGNVVDDIAKPLPGVIISVKGENIQTSSDDKGNYTITLPGTNNILVFRMVGMITKEITVATGENFVKATLLPDLKNLEEVVVVGYGTVKKSDLTGSVSTLKGSDLNRTPSASVDQLLQGKIPGVQVISGSGRPGAGATIRIRGTSSLNGSNSPLMVVDGFPWGDAGNLKQINPDDIESIEVLKDASSAAIYGSRGANGVILITTKKGKIGQSNISLSTLNTISAMSAKPDLWRDAIDEATFANEAALTGGTPANQLPYLGELRGGVYFPSISELRGLDPSKPKWPHDTDWVDLVYRKPFSQSYTLTADGGSEKTKYAISGNYYKEEGLVIKNFYDRFATRLNLDQKLTDAINVGTNVILTYTKNNGVQVNADRTRVFPVYDDKGNYFRTSPTDFGHPLANANEVLNTSKTIDVLGTVYANAKITKWLQFRTQLSSKYGNSIGDVYEPAIVTFRGFESNGFGAINNFNTTELLTENYLTALKNFGKDHSINFVAGYSFQKFNTRTSDLIGNGFVNDNIKNENLSTAANRIISNGLSRSELASWFGRANYVFKDRYLFTLTARADGSSKFGSNNKWGYFPSGAVAWKANEEEFIKSLNFFSELKFRVSYGLTGNQGISPYQTLDRFGTARYFTGDGFQTGFGPGLSGANNEQGLTIVGGLGNNSLKWETTTSLDLGVDIGFMDQRFRLTIDYYNKNTDDLLRLRTIAPSSGFDEQWINDGEINNKGIEIGLNADIIRKSDFSWNLGVNFTRNRNKVISMGEKNRVEVGTLYELVRQRILTYTVGQPMFAYYGYKSNGIIQTVQEGIASGLTGAAAQPGEIKYLDISGPNGTPDGVIDGNDRTIIGNPTPDFLYSFNTNLKYKRFDLSAQFYGIYGNDVFDFRKLTPSRQILRWTPDNPSNDIPRANNTRGLLASDFFITDGSFLRIQNVTLGYNFKPNPVKGIKSLRIFFSGNNLYTFTKFNPGFDAELGENGVNEGAYPRPRAISLGLNIGL